MLTFIEENDLINETGEAEYITIALPKYMTVNELCEKYDLKPKTVYKRIEYNKDKALAGHIRREKGKSMLLDEAAQEFLKPISLRIKEISDMCYDTVSKNDELSEMVAFFTRDNRRLKSELDTANTEIEQYKKELAECQAKLKKSKDDNAKSENIISELRAELESERGIFKTVLNDKSSTIADCNATIAEYEAAQEAAAKKGKGFFGLKP